MTTGIIRNEQDLEKHIEKHMAGGCMAGFFNLFDRNHILSSHHGHNRRLYAPKRLLPSSSRPSSPAVDSASESVSSVGSPSSRFKDFDKPPPQSPTPQPLRTAPFSTPDKSENKNAPVQSKSPSTISSFKGEEPVAVGGGSKVSPWKFTREAPRLSLDSRAVIDAKGKLRPREIRTNTASMLANRRQSSAGCTTEYDDEESERQRRSPSVIARLMGLDPLTLPSQSSPSDCETPGDSRKSELRRSASESRSRDLLQCRFVEGNNNNFSTAPGYQYNYTSNFNVTARDNHGGGGFVAADIPSNNCRTNVRQFDNVGGRQNIARGSSIAAPARQNHTQRTSSRPSPPNSHQNYHNNNHHMTRKGFYDSGDFFPDLKQPAAGGNGIEKRLKMRGIEEASKDLETLKQILDALQLKGLLHHSSKEEQQQGSGDRSTFLNHPSHHRAQSPPVVLMKTGRSQPETDGFRTRTTPLPRRNLSCDTTAAASPRLARSPARSPRSPCRSEKGSSVVSTRNQGLNVETGRRSNGMDQQQQQQQRRRGCSSPIQSPRMIGSPRRMDQTMNRSPRSSPRRRSAAEFVGEKGRRGEEDESSTVSESSCFSTSTDTERSKIEDYKDGKSILERCDKLLHSIAEMNSATMVATSKNNNNNSNGSSSGELQPSPVSVLDPSYYKEEEESPSPIKQRTIYFTDQQVVELDEEAWSSSSSPSSATALPPALSLLKSSCSSDDAADEDDINPEVAYISDVLRASDYFPDDTNSDLFLLLEKHQSLKGRDTTTKASRLNRRLLFDATTEIVNRNRLMPPWKSCSLPEGRSAQLREIWAEIQRIRSSRDGYSDSDDLLEEICRVMKRDMNDDSIQGWKGSHMEVSEAVLDIERLIFKDLIGETIRDLAVTTGSEEVGYAPRRKLVF